MTLELANVIEILDERWLSAATLWKFGQEIECSVAELESSLEKVASIAKMSVGGMFKRGNGTAAGMDPSSRVIG